MHDFLASLVNRATGLVMLASGAGGWLLDHVLQMPSLAQQVMYWILSVGGAGIVIWSQFDKERRKSYVAWSKAREETLQGQLDTLAAEARAVRGELDVARSRAKVNRAKIAVAVRVIKKQAAQIKAQQDEIRHLGEQLDVQARMLVGFSCGDAKSCGDRVAAEELHGWNAGGRAGGGEAGRRGGPVGPEVEGGRRLDRAIDGPARPDP